MPENYEIPQEHSLDYMEGVTSAEHPIFLSRWNKIREDLNIKISSIESDYKYIDYEKDDNETKEKINEMDARVHQVYREYRDAILEDLINSSLENETYNKILKKIGDEKPKHIAEELFLDYVLFIKECVEGWHKIKPDIIFVTDSSAVPIGMAMKDVYKKLYPNEDVSFHRIASRDDLFEEIYQSTGGGWKMKDKGYPIRNKNIKKWVDNMNNFTESIGDNLKDKRVIIYDEAGSTPSKEFYSSVPIQITREGKKYDEFQNRFLSDNEKRDIKPGSGTGSAAVILRDYFGFKNIWIHYGSPGYGPNYNRIPEGGHEYYKRTNIHSYFDLITRDGRASHGQKRNVVKKYINVKPKDDRKEAEEFLKELKLAGEYVIQLSRAENKEFSGNESGDIEFKI